MNFRNSFRSEGEVTKINPGALDIESLFANKLLDEIIRICLHHLFTIEHNICDLSIVVERSCVISESTVFLPMHDITVELFLNPILVITLLSHSK